MRKIISLSLFIFFILSGCDNGEQMVLLDEKVAEIEITKSNGFGDINDEDVLLSFRDAESLQFLTEAITSARKHRGKTDISNPDFDVIVTYDGTFPKHGLHLVLGKENEKSAFIYITDEETVYYTTTKSTKKLRELLEES